MTLRLLDNLGACEVAHEEPDRGTSPCVCLISNCSLISSRNLSVTRRHQLLDTCHVSSSFPCVCAVFLADGGHFE